MKQTIKRGVHIPVINWEGKPVRSETWPFRWALIKTSGSCAWKTWFRGWFRLMHKIYMQKYLVASKGGNHEPSRLLAGCGLRKQPWVVITPENVLGCRTCDNKSLNKRLRSQWCSCPRNTWLRVCKIWTSHYITVCIRSARHYNMHSRVRDIN